MEGDGKEVQGIREEVEGWRKKRVEGRQVKDGKPSDSEMSRLTKERIRKGKKGSSESGPRLSGRNKE